MPREVSYTRRRKEWYSGSGGAPPAANLVTVAKGHCAARVTFADIPGFPGVFAAVPSPREGKITSIAIRLLDGVAPTGEAMVTIVSPEADVTAAFLYAFLGEIVPTTVGPPMYRRMNIRSAYYCTDMTDVPEMLYILIVGGTGLTGASADVAVMTKTH